MEAHWGLHVPSARVRYSPNIFEVRFVFAFSSNQVYLKSLPLLQHLKQYLRPSSSHIAAPLQVLTWSNHLEGRLSSEVVQSTTPNIKDGTSRNRNHRAQRHIARIHRPRILPCRDQQPTHPSHDHNLDNHWKNHINLRVRPTCLQVPVRHALHRLQSRSTAPWTGRRTRALK